MGLEFNLGLKNLMGNSRELPKRKLLAVILASFLLISLISLFSYSPAKSTPSTGSERKVSERKAEEKVSASKEEKKCDLSERKIKQMLSDIKIYIQENELDEALKLIDQILCAKPSEVNAIYYKAFINYLKGNYKEALELLDIVLDRTESFPQAKLYKGACLIHLGKYSEALEYLDRYILLRPEEPLGYAFKYEALWAMEKYQEALATLDKGIELTKSNALRLMKCDALLQLGRIAELRELMDEVRASELRARGELSGDTASDLAWFSFLIGDLKAMRAYIKEAKSSRRISEDSSLLIDVLSSENLEEALKRMNRYEGNDPRIYYLRGLIAYSVLRKLISEGKSKPPKGAIGNLYALALNSFKKACELEPTNLIYQKACKEMGISLNRAVEGEERELEPEEANEKTQK